MKVWILVAALAISMSRPAYAQFGGIVRKAQEAQDRKKQFDDLTVTEDEEKQIGLQVSEKVRQRFGVVQNPAVTKYVTLVGTVLTQLTDRPKLPWTFIVLDTDGVNAFAAPGGYVHITRGALALIKTEAELAGVLGHETTHVVHKHTVNAIRKNKAVQIGANETLANRSEFLTKIADKAYDIVLENAFDRGDELDADATGVALAQKAGYAPGALADFLARLDERNKNQPQKNGLFASHPETKERIEKVKQVAGTKPGALVAERYTSTIKYQPTDITKIAVVAEGEKDDTAKTEEPPKKKGFGLGSLKTAVAPEKSSQQVAASGGARGVGPDRLAKGGDNPNLVSVTVTADDVAAFKRGIA